jgi:folylpolyglutamate synthase/dihydropteroate synthase
VAGHAFPERNRALAREASRVAGELLLGSADGEPAEVPADVPGRFQTGTVRGVPFVADAGHNPAAWRAFLGALGPPAGAVAVVALTRQRSIAELAAALAEHGGFAHVYATGAVVRPTHDPAEIARLLATRGVDATACVTPDGTFERAVADAHRRGTRLVVFGSTYLVTDFLAWVRGSSQSSSERQSHSSPR